MVSVKGPQEGAEEQPTSKARVRFEKADCKADVEVPSHHAVPLFERLVYALCAVGAVLGPALILLAMPASQPAWVLVTAIGGQFTVEIVVIVGLHKNRP